MGDHERDRQDRSHDGTSPWLDEVARELGVAPLGEDEVDALLDLARDVAHGTERRYAPLTCFLVGLAAAGDRAAVADVAARLGERAAGR